MLALTRRSRRFLEGLSSCGTAALRHARHIAVQHECLIDPCIEPCWCSNLKVQAEPRLSSFCVLTGFEVVGKGMAWDRHSNLARAGKKMPAIAHLLNVIALQQIRQCFQVQLPCGPVDVGGQLGRRRKGETCRLRRGGAAIHLMAPSLRRRADGRWQHVSIWTSFAGRKRPAARLLSEMYSTRSDKSTMKQMYEEYSSTHALHTY